MENQTAYYNRDLSWLQFNKRILLEAADSSIPIYERIKFLAIYSSNLDEFFRVRVASLRTLAIVQEKKKIKKALDFVPEEILKTINKKVSEQLEAFGRIYRNEISPQLAENNIILYRDEPLKPVHKKAIDQYFRSKVLAYLRPEIIDNKEKEVFLQNRDLYFFVCIQQQNAEGDAVSKNAVLNIPSDALPRFIKLPKVGNQHYYIFLDDVIRHNLHWVFPNFEIEGCYSIKVNRNADLNIDDEFSGNLVEKIEKQLSKRKVGLPTRFLFDKTIPQLLREELQETLKLGAEDMVEGGRYHNFNDFFSFPNPLKPSLEEAPLPSLEHAVLEQQPSILSAIDKGDQILHFPYHSYNYVLRFFNEAAIDPDVTDIRVTVYRIAANSFIGNALISAARNGKKVTVFVELKARFDEENNLQWAAKMQQAGIDIIYSIPGLKVHAKIALVTRKNGDAKETYALLSTGNFNELTARVYADHALFTKDPILTNDLLNVFKYLKKRKELPEVEELLVAQVNMQQKFLALLDREIEQAKAGKQGHCILKFNNLEDKVMIDKLVEASQAGVKVELIIRGICCIRPGIAGITENITVLRLVDRFLEHARLFWFYNDGAPQVFLSSADWMKRNLYHRIEVAFELKDPKVADEVMQIVAFQQKDTEKARFLDAEHHHELPVPPENGNDRVRAQLATYEWVKSLGN